MYKNKILNKKIFKVVIDSVPLISIDILLKKDNRFLLGKRINKPAQGHYFTIGGRVFKNETLDQAIQRVAKFELNIDLKLTPKFIGVFEHFYDDGIYKDVSTHYVNLAYEIEVENLPDFPFDQHAEYRWLTIDELFKSKQVHKYVKDYFKD
jgi:colanic acid biosynthesis protein WcaH